VPKLFAPLAVSAMVFFCTFAAAVFGMVLHKKLSDDHLSEDSKDVIKLVMGLIATMAALVLGLLIASANSSYETQSSELQQVSAAIVELDGILAQYGSEANDSRHRLRVAVLAAANKIWSKDGVQFDKLTPVANHPEAAAFYESIAKLSPTTDTQRFIQKRAPEISGELRHARALMLEQANSSIAWPFLAVLVYWISMLFVGFGLFARTNAAVILALVIGALSVSRAIFLILELNRPYLGLMHISDAPLRNAGPDRAMNASQKPRPTARGHGSFRSGMIGVKPRRVTRPEAALRRHWTNPVGWQTLHPRGLRSTPGLTKRGSKSQIAADI
jgi:hypothetical protein